MQLGAPAGARTRSAGKPVDLRPEVTLRTVGVGDQAGDAYAGPPGFGVGLDRFRESQNGLLELLHGLIVKTPNTEMLGSGGCPVGIRR